ncbi:serine/threonine-protein kinase [Luedemannella helvata]
MAEVWTARDTVLDRPVIVKVLAVSDVDLLRRFRREALLTAKLSHPGVPRIFDLDLQGTRPYLVLEKIDGLTLADLAAEQEQLPVAWVASIGAQISAVLIAAHELGLVHRDIKPSNVMIEASGAVKVLDFGLAVMPQDERYSRITKTSESPGTVGYMAPEQINAQPTDHRADLYALGATLYHLITGQEPFGGTTTITTAHRQIFDEPPRPAALRPDLPAALDDLVHHLMSIDPGKRPSSATEVHTILTPYASPRPPIPGVIDEGVNAVRAYAAAIVGQTPAPAHHIEPPRPRMNSYEHEADEASRLLAGGQARAAARQWRQLAERYAQQHGEHDPKVFEWRRQAARAHLQMDEHDRALRQLETVLTRQIQAVGPDHATVRELRQEIADLRQQLGDRS